MYQLYQKAHTPWKWFKRLKKVADDIDLGFFVTAFDASSVDFLEGLSVPVHKIASFELTDLPLIEYAAAKRRPIIISTGMGTIDEIREAVSTAKRAGAPEIMLLKCVSSYPADPRDMNLNTIADMRRRFKLPVGISDHTLDEAVSIAAVCLGAEMVEKHFTLSRRFKTPDSFFSTEPDEFKRLVRSIRTAEAALGKTFYGLTQEQKATAIFRRSIFAVSDIRKGERFTPGNVRSIRPAYGLAPKYLKKVLSSKARKNISAGMPLTRDMV